MRSEESLASMQGVRVCSHLHDQRTPPKMFEHVKHNLGIGSTPEARMLNMQNHQNRPMVLHQSWVSWHCPVFLIWSHALCNLVHVLRDMLGRERHEQRVSIPTRYSPRRVSQIQEARYRDKIALSSGMENFFVDRDRKVISQIDWVKKRNEHPQVKVEGQAIPNLRFEK